jgi:hypothetical protein
MKRGIYSIYGAHCHLSFLAEHSPKHALTIPILKITLSLQHPNNKPKEPKLAMGTCVSHPLFLFRTPPFLPYKRWNADGFHHTSPDAVKISTPTRANRATMEAVPHSKLR